MTFLQLMLKKESEKKGTVALGAFIGQLSTEFACLWNDLHVLLVYL